MCPYEHVSGMAFSLIAIVQLARLVARWPVQVATVSVSLWVSAVAFVIAAALAAWAFTATTPSSR